MAVTIDQMNVDVQLGGSQGQEQAQGQGSGQPQAGASAPEPMNFRQEHDKLAERELRLKAD